EAIGVRVVLRLIDAVRNAFDALANDSLSVCDELGHSRPHGSEAVALDRPSQLLFRSAQCSKMRLEVAPDVLWSPGVVQYDRQDVLVHLVVLEEPERGK